ncbi:MAG TPA: helix-turn-helix domain-containing protein, partial [Nitrospirota bacterium]
MANILNYKYEIFPTAPQRTQLNKILRGTRLQWNKAVTIRKKLKRALIAGQVEHVINTCLSVEKDNRQSSRKSAIEKFQEA